MTDLFFRVLKDTWVVYIAQSACLYYFIICMADFAQIGRNPKY